MQDWHFLFDQKECWIKIIQSWKHLKKASEKLYVFSSVWLRLFTDKSLTTMKIFRKSLQCYTLFEVRIHSRIFIHSQAFHGRKKKQIRWARKTRKQTFLFLFHLWRSRKISFATFWVFVCAKVFEKAANDKEPGIRGIIHLSSIWIMLGINILR